MINYYFLLKLAYNGTNYSGWVIQKKQKTIQGCLNKAIKNVIKSDEFRTIGASKTDAGVHALDQKVWLQTQFKPNLSGFMAGVNKALPSDIRIIEIIEVNEEFHVRNTFEKIYKYQINNGEYDLLSENWTNFYNRQKLCLEELRKYAELFVGIHDFFAFSGLSLEEKEQINTNREIKSILVEEESNNNFAFYFKAKGFIRYQIRTIVQTILALCENKITIDFVKDSLEGIFVKKMPYRANPKGLILLEISYGGEFKSMII
ncbi:tRNA pseudouridine(38-40) synthase TruA [Spiroplasma alleghenense]|uniref:tRNA pseudouridine synthase A n=1 Tax=Spiroplasma alleghenense TaxID=216931 RepID=A0A345Z361_9MOLU|nr:tRNA pseudouridine(38-40) synthase TruA [Spiroplasma alleghenense]AXK51040.1 tRNA pseudouridine synthase A [Spiroplasma alleghenense]